MIRLALAEDASVEAASVEGFSSVLDHALARMGPFLIEGVMGR